MSGGSWNYLHSQWRDGYGATFESVAERLKGTLGATEAAEIAALFREAEQRWEKFAGVLRAMEWVDSGDSSPEDLDEAVREWVNQK